MGRAAALCMAKEGAAVVALDVNEQQLQDLRVIMLSV